jgi:hypothetical protein
MLPIHTILFPTDLAESSNRMRPLACALARVCDDRIVVRSVTPSPVVPDEIEARHHPDECYSGPLNALHRLLPVPSFEIQEMRC